MAKPLARKKSFLQKHSLAKKGLTLARHSPCQPLQGAKCEVHAPAFGDFYIKGKIPLNNPLCICKQYILKEGKYYVF